jgi:cytoskeletal protein CcmA (bactofilin family)
MSNELETTVEVANEGPSGTEARIGKSFSIKGEVSSSEDLYVDGQVEGTIALQEHHLTIGPSGRAQADVNAKGVVVLGTVKGKVQATDRVEIRKTGSVVGDLVTARLTIEEGAHFKGSIDIKNADESTAQIGRQQAKARNR